MSRPFGVALLVAGQDVEDGYQLVPHGPERHGWTAVQGEGDRKRERGGADGAAGGVQRTT